MDNFSRLERLQTSPLLPDGTKPTRLGSGTIVSKLGEGGVAIVYEIWNKELGVARAVKLLRTATNQNVLKRFRTEMSVTAQFNHPNIVQIHSVGDWHGLPYIEMEHIGGESLTKLIAARGALPLHVCTAIGIMVCRALNFTHNHEYAFEGKTYPGILHRDLKPQNIMIEKNGVIKLMDFGTATPTNVSLNTVDGTFIGSLLYVAPEQLLGGHGDERSDLYSLGSVLYEMLVGRKVFQERDISKLLADRGKNKYKRLGSYDVQIPKVLRRLVERCLMKDNSKRIQNAKTVLAELEKIHKRLTKLSPEGAVKQFIESEESAHIVTLRYQFSTATGTLIIVSTSTLLILTVMFFTLLIQDQIRKKKTVSKPPSLQLVKKKVDTTTVDSSEAQSAVSDKRARKRYKKKAPRTQPVIPPPNHTWPQLVLGQKVRNPSRLIETLKREYRTQDMLMILSGELHKGHYVNAWHTYQALDKLAQRNRSKAADSLYVTISSYRRHLERFFETSDIAAREFYLVKAYLSYKQYDYRSAMSLLHQAQTTASGPRPNGAIDRTVTYYKALAATLLYKDSKTDSLKNALIQSWTDVKGAFAEDRDHRYSSAAEYQITRFTTQNNQ